MAKVLLFGWFAEKAGWAERNIDADGLEQLRQLVGECHPDIAASLASGKGRAALNHSLVSGDMVIKADDEVAFFPPVSGG